MADALASALTVAGDPAYASDPASALTIAKIRALLCAYALRWSEDDFRIQSVERSVTAPLWHRTTDGRSRSFSLAGKLDVTILDPENQYAVVDHKTTGDEINDVNGTYFQQQIIKGQWLQYILLERFNGRKVDHVLLNVLRKPSISPRTINQAEWLKSLRTGRYFGLEVSPESAEYGLTNKSENLELYSTRLLYDATVERPGFYFARRKLSRVDKLDLAGYHDDLWLTSQDMLADRRSKVHLRSSHACMAFGVPCQFLRLCSGADSEDSDRWETAKNVHAELPELPGESRHYLTNSRIEMFKLCRQKHHYLYNLGIRRQEPSASRDFGTLWHDALAAYYRTVQEEQQETNEVRLADTQIEQGIYA